MIKVMNIKLDSVRKEADVELFADTKAEVSTAALGDIHGMISGYAIGAGSFVVTAEGELAFMKSDGNWSWVSSGASG